jgi:hypothetical protein
VDAAASKIKSKQYGFAGLYSLGHATIAVMLDVHPLVEKLINDLSSPPIKRNRDLTKEVS